MSPRLLERRGWQSWPFSRRIIAVNGFHTKTTLLSGSVVPRNIVSKQLVGGFCTHLLYPHFCSCYLLLRTVLYHTSGNVVKVSLTAKWNECNAHIFMRTVRYNFYVVQHCPFNHHSNFGRYSIVLYCMLPSHHYCCHGHHHTPLLTSTLYLYND